jgi:hypothetical protein
LLPDSPLSAHFRVCHEPEHLAVTLMAHFHSFLFVVLSLASSKEFCNIA